MAYRLDRTWPLDDGDVMRVVQTLWNTFVEISTPKRLRDGTTVFIEKKIYNFRRP